MRSETLAKREAMTRKQFLEWLATCPANENGKESGWFVANDGGYDMRVFFYFDDNDSEANNE
tara:strand:+ start:1536 stop:1721 length:186 start_codon:yes stop_codon:yes gene_type:complete